MRALKCISHSAKLEDYVTSNPGFPNNLLTTYCQFIGYIGDILGDLTFLTKGPASRIHTAIDYCLTIKRVCECAAMLKRRLSRDKAMVSATVDESLFETYSFTPEFFSNIVQNFKQWYEVILEISLTMMEAPVIQQKSLASARTLLLQKIGRSMTAVASLDTVYIDPAPSMLDWLMALQSEGFQVFQPNVLFKHETALGLILSKSYTFGPSNLFAESVFSLILPTLSNESRFFLDGSSVFMDYASVVLSNMHLIPPDDSKDMDSPPFVYPVIRRKDAIKLKQHLGSLLYFGIFCLICNDRNIRCKGLLFLKELMEMFQSDDSFNVEEFFGSKSGLFYGELSTLLLPEVIAVTKVISEICKSETTSFLWEAVRSMYSYNADKQTSALIYMDQAVFTIIAPWCKNVNLGALDEDVANSEFYRFIVESALSDAFGIVECWTEIASSAKYGKTNTLVLLDTVISMFGKDSSIQTQLIKFVGLLFSIRPEIVAQNLSFYLTPDAFAWKKFGNEANHSSENAIKTYVETRVYDAEIEHKKSANSVKRASAASLIAQLILSGFESFESSIASILLFSLFHLKSPTKDGTAASNLLHGLVLGFIRFMHKKNYVMAEGYSKIRGLIKKLLCIFEMKVCEISWDWDVKIDPILKPFTESIHISDFVEMLIRIFSNDFGDFSKMLISECLKLANDGFLDPTSTYRALHLYCILLKREESLSVNFENPLLERLYDQLAVLKQIESGTDSGDWSNLASAGLVELKSSATQISVAILKLHAVILNRMNIRDSLDENPSIFWALLGLLKMPSHIFPEITSLVLELMLFYISNAGNSLVTPFFDTQINRLNEKQIGLQSLLQPYLFSDDAKIRELALKTLLRFCVYLPESAVDPNPTGRLYTFLYTISWISMAFELNETSKETVNILDLV
jgi:hypothetical protein